MVNLPDNVSVSSHPCLAAKLSQLRSKDTLAKDVKTLVHEISLILGCEALGKVLKTTLSDEPNGETPLGFRYNTTSTDSTPDSIFLVPIMRSGLAMVDAIQTILPHSATVHHLGLYREPTTLSPVEYYNNLPNQVLPPSTSAAQPHPARTAFILDPIIATGGTCVAAIQTLQVWGAERIIVLSVLGAAEGVRRAADVWPAGVQICLAGVDAELTDRGMLKPGLGDIGDRLFLTIGK